MAFKGQGHIVIRGGSRFLRRGVTRQWVPNVPVPAIGTPLLGGLGACPQKTLKINVHFPAI